MRDKTFNAIIIKSEIQSCGMETPENGRQNSTDRDAKDRQKLQNMEVGRPEELLPAQWRQLQIDPICENFTSVEKMIGKLVYKRVLRKSLALMVANDIQYQHVIDHNGMKAICEITNYIFTSEYLATKLETSHFENIRAIVLIICQKQLRADHTRREPTDKAIFVSKKMMPQWKVKCFKLDETSTIKCLLDKIDSLMRSQLIMDLKIAIDEIGVSKIKHVVIWANCIAHKSVNCQGTKGLYASEYPKISSLCE